MAVLVLVAFVGLVVLGRVGLVVLVRVHVRGLVLPAVYGRPVNTIHGRGLVLGAFHLVGAVNAVLVNAVPVNAVPVSAVPVHLVRLGVFALLLVTTGVRLELAVCTCNTESLTRPAGRSNEIA